MPIGRVKTLALAGGGAVALLATGAAGAVALTSSSSGSSQTNANKTVTLSAADQAQVAAQSGSVLNWQCGPATPATIWKSGAKTGKTLRSCIGTDHNYLYLMGILTGSRNDWKEQIDLVLKDAKQSDHGHWLSPVCTTSPCIFTMAIKPGHGNWTVLPKWDRYNSYYQSTGHEPAFINY